MERGGGTGRVKPGRPAPNRGRGEKKEEIRIESLLATFSWGTVVSGRAEGAHVVRCRQRCAGSRGSAMRVRSQGLNSGRFASGADPWPGSRLHRRGDRGTERPERDARVLRSGARADRFVR